MNGSKTPPRSGDGRAPGQRGRVRMVWPDVAKGISILGVVVLHVCLFVPESEHTLLAEINYFLDPLRMPLFFMVSGFFAVKVLNFTFVELFTRRLWFFIVPYLLWSPIELYAHRLELLIHLDLPMAEPFVFVESALRGSGMYWFLQALIVFNLVLWCTRKLPGWAVVVLALAPTVLMPAFGDYEIVRRLVMYLPAFLVGAYFRPLITRFAETATKPRNVVLAVGLYVAGMGVAALWAWLNTREPGDIHWALINLKDQVGAALGGELTPFDLGHYQGTIVHVISLPAGILLAVAISRVGWLSRFFRFLGRHTLVIYLGHPLGLTLIFGLYFKYDRVIIDNSSSNPMYWSSTWVLICLAFAALGALAVYGISKIPVLRWSVFPPPLTYPQSNPQPKDSQTVTMREDVPPTGRMDHSETSASSRRGDER